MKIELVTHCLATENPNFAGALALQISSLLLDQPKHCDVQITVCMNEEDVNTVRVVRHFAKLQHNGLRIKALNMPIDELGRRCIGRNHAALYTNADIVWFTDVDHCFYDGILDRLVSLEWPVSKVPDEGRGVPVSMMFPGEIMISKNWDIGDEETKGLAAVPELKPLDAGNFVTKGYNRAIGGVQIVRGKFARAHGYLNGNDDWQTPVKKPFGSFRDDIAYRDFCSKHGPIVKVDLPGVYRLRHGKTSYEADRTPEDNAKELNKHK